MTHAILATWTLDSTEQSTEVALERVAFPSGFRVIVDGRAIARVPQPTPVRPWRHVVLPRLGAQTAVVAVLHPDLAVSAHLMVDGHDVSTGETEEECRSRAMSAAQSYRQLVARRAVFQPWLTPIAGAGFALPFLVGAFSGRPLLLVTTALLVFLAITMWLRLTDLLVVRFSAESRLSLRVRSVATWLMLAGTLLILVGVLQLVDTVSTLVG